MAEDRHASDDELRAIVLGAISAAPAMHGLQAGAWIARVNEAIPHVAAMMRRGLLPEHDSRQIRNAREVAEAEVFTGIYHAHEIESSSTRVLVMFSSERGTTVEESIRTHRTDTTAGRVMQARLDKLSPGDRIVIYKAMEEMSGSQGRKVRTLVHFETLPPRTDTQQAARSGTPIPTEAPAAQGSPPETIKGGEPDLPNKPPPYDGDDVRGHPDRQSGSGHPRGPDDPDFGPAPDTPPESRGQDVVDGELADAFNALPPKVKVNVVRRLRESDITFPTPQVDKIDAFLAIVKQEERNG
jgi:hypothetical protein